MIDDIILTVTEETTAFVLRQTTEPSPFLLTGNSSNNVVISIDDTVVGEVSLKGPKGDDGAATSEYTHNQLSPLATWTVNHNLGRKPSSVTVLSPGGVEVEASVIHINDNQLQVSFALPYSGTARII